MYIDIPSKHYKSSYYTVNGWSRKWWGRPCYLPETDELDGLCEHAATEVPSVKMGKDLTASLLSTFIQAVRDGKVHVAKGIFVAALARNDETDYGAKPVLLMPTCKKGSYHDAAFIMGILRQAWKVSSCWISSWFTIVNRRGPKRCPALNLHCLVRDLTPADSYGFLPGLNLWVGSSGETQNLDYKHDMKRDFVVSLFSCSIEPLQGFASSLHTWRRSNQFVCAQQGCSCCMARTSDWYRLIWKKKIFSLLSTDSWTYTHSPQSQRCSRCSTSNQTSQPHSWPAESQQIIIWLLRTEDLFCTFCSWRNARVIARAVHQLGPLNLNLENDWSTIFR